MAAPPWNPTWSRLGLIALAAALAGGCGDAASAYRSVIRDQTRAFEELERILSTVTDPTSMKAAHAELRERWDRFEAIKERALALPRVSLRIEEQIHEETVQLGEAFSRVRQHWNRITALPGGEDFLRQFGQGKGILGGQVP